MTQELRRLAEAANIEQGWHGELDMRRYVDNHADAAYIAAANPAAILSLLDRLEKAEKDAARCKRFIDEVCEETFDTWTNGYRMQQVAINIKAAMESSK